MCSGVIVSISHARDVRLLAVLLVAAKVADCVGVVFPYESLVNVII